MQTKIEKVNGIEVLTVSMPIQPRPSKSGKTTVIASSNGNIVTPANYEGKAVTIGLNAYVKK